METQAESPNNKRKKDVVSARKLDRAFKVFELRKKGRSYRSISKILRKQAEEKGESTRGFSHTQAKTDFELAVRIKNEDLGNMVEEARTLTAERLDDIFLRISPLLNNTDSEIKLKAAGVLVKANKEYADLFGAKKPQKLEVTGEDGKPLSVVTQVVLDFSGETPSGPPSEDRKESEQ